MSRIEKRKLVGLAVALMLVSIGIVVVIDIHFSLNPWGDGEVEVLWYFLLGSIFFPGALRRYRAGRQGEQKVPWYHRLDLIACLIGLVCGLMFALSVVEKWVSSILLSTSTAIDEGSLTALNVAVLIVSLCWIALTILLFVQMIKQIKQQKTQPPQAT